MKEATNAYKLAPNTLLKQINIPAEHLPALKALAKNDNRDLKNFIEHTLITMAIGEEREGKRSLSAPINGPEVANGVITIPLVESAVLAREGTGAKSKVVATNNTFLEKRRNAKNNVK